MDQPLLIVGASVRAAAFSALRAGLTPWCADLFGDEDLRARCPVERVVPQNYPNDFEEILRRAPAGPLIYTGGLENYRALVRRLAKQRPLWGNDAAVLNQVRSPRRVASLLDAAGLPCPALRLRADEVPPQGRWLVKPLASAGGTGIRFWEGDATPQTRESRVYIQEFIEGDPCSAVYFGDGKRGRLLGATRQLIGENWLHCRAFQYCGSIGPLRLAAKSQQTLEKIGDALVAGSGLKGLFGVDFILSDDVPWPVEVNPRYPASAEILEFASGVQALAWHRHAFDSTTYPPILPSTAVRPAVVGKAVLFARAPLSFPAEGPWLSALGRSSQIEDMPAYADIPRAGEIIPAGRPILTVFARGTDFNNCRERLRECARELDALFDER